MSLLAVHQLLPEINYSIYSQLSEKRSTTLYEYDYGKTSLQISSCHLLSNCPLLCGTKLKVEVFNYIFERDVKFKTRCREMRRWALTCNV